VPADVEAVGEASAEKLCDQREQPEGEPGKEALVPTRPIHVWIVLLRKGAGKTTASRLARAGALGRKI